MTGKGVLIDAADEFTSDYLNFVCLRFSVFSQMFICFEVYQLWLGVTFASFQSKGQLMNLYNIMNLFKSKLLLTLCLVLLARMSFTFTQEDIQYPQQVEYLCLKNSLIFFKHTILKTPNNNQLYVLGITSPEGNKKNYQDFLGSPAILITSVMHLREDTSFRFVKEAVEYIVTQYGKGNKEIKYLLQRAVLLVMPFVNIDAVMHSLTLSQAQALEFRKNMNLGKFDKCKQAFDRGVDINRNFAYNFGTQATSKDPCSQQYRGVSPFSQPESQSIQTLFQHFQVITNIDVHSYGNIWIYPYASDINPNKIKEHGLYKQYEYIFQGFKERNITFDNCYHSLNYLADGVYIDWALQKNSLSFALQFGDEFLVVGKEMEKQIDALMLVLKVNVNAFSYYLSAEREENDDNKADKGIKLCVKSLSSIEHNVILLINNEAIEGKRLPIDSDVCFITDVTNVLKLHESMPETSKDKAKVEVKLGQSEVKEQIHLEKLKKSYKFQEEPEESFLKGLFKQFKVFIISIAILCGIGCLCGLSIFFEGSLGLRLNDQEGNHLTESQELPSIKKNPNLRPIGTEQQKSSHEMIDPELRFQAEMEEANQFEDK